MDAADAVWDDMQRVRADPRYPATLDLPGVDEDDVVRLHVLVQMPRVWLDDGRAAQAREAVAAVERLMEDVDARP